MAFGSLWFLLFVVPVVLVFFFTRKKGALHFSSVKLLRAAAKGKTIKHKIGKYLVLAGIILSIVALARPQTPLDSDFMQQGIDIALLLDVSGSMQSVDFEPNRLEVARKTIDDFVKERGGDRVSLIVFAGTAFTRIPLTLDHSVVRESLALVTTDSVNQDGTAIGMAISVGLNRLKKSDAPSRVMILVTDGDNNAGDIDPMTASRLAQELGIRIYTIGVGTDTLLMPVTNIFGQTQYQQYDGGFDEALLEEIAAATGGQYFRALDPGALAKIFDTINQLEKSGAVDDGFQEHNELAFPLIILGLILLLVGVFLDRYWFVQVP